MTNAFQFFMPASRLAATALAILAVSASGREETGSRLDLRDNWLLQSSRKISQPPEVLSSPRFSPDDWRRTTVPSTVLASQVAGGEFKNIFYGDNLSRLPGMNSTPGGKGANPYAAPWWYRTEFRLPREFKGRNLWLHFNGINAKANVWMNGRKLGDACDVAGAFRIFELDATSAASPDGINVLAVEVFPPTDDDFGINLVDWIPTPPDKDMGLWREVYLTASGPVRLRYPTVATHFPGASLERADLTVRVELVNDTDSPVAGRLLGGFDAVSIEKPVRLAPRERRAVTFTPGEFPQLRLENPRLWWPLDQGEQILHLLSMRFETSGVISDSQVATFGIREITGELYGGAPRMGEVFDNNGDFTNIKTDERPLLIRVNHRPVLIRGGGWCPDMLMRTSPDRLRAELGYVRDMHLNAIRLEGKLEGEEFFDLADRMGILILAGWCCGDRWEHWDSWKPNDYSIAHESLRTQILRLRHHASLALWMNGSDNPPPARVETAYRNILVENGWPNPFVSSASSMPTSVSGASGVKMTGPYDYVPPGYWLLDTRHFGGAFGFNTETSPGAAIPDLGSLKKFLPKDRLWPINGLWNLHAGAGSLNDNLTHFNESMNAIYGPPRGLDDYLLKAQAMDYDGERAMFEAYGRNKYRSTGVIQWMLNNGWPSVIWHLYDYYLEPAAGYFGAKKACEPLHIQYSYDDRSVVVVNNLDRTFTALTAGASLYDFNLRQVFAKRVDLDSAADSVQRLLIIPSGDTATDVSFVRLTLQDGTGRSLSTNFYWLPRTPSTFDWSLAQARAHPYYTAVKSYEDLTALNRLPKARVEATASARHLPAGETVAVTIRNPSANLAFQIHLSLAGVATGEEVLPVLWEDNYVSLMPGESRTIVARYDAVADAGPLALVVDGWNVGARTLPVVESGR